MRARRAAPLPLLSDCTDSNLGDDVGRVHPEVMRVYNQGIRPQFEEEFPEYRLRITSGFRSRAAQNRLYAQGRTRPGAIVTHARGGESSHNWGLAIDVLIVPRDGRDPWAFAHSRQGRKAYRALHEIGRLYGMEDITASVPGDIYHLQVAGWRQVVSRSGRVRRA